MMGYGIWDCRSWSDGRRKEGKVFSCEIMGDTTPILQETVRSKHIRSSLSI